MNVDDATDYDESDYYGQDEIEIEPPMSSKEYAEYGGMYCPYCGSVRLSHENNMHSSTMDEITFSQHCEDCKAWFTKVYILSGYKESGQ